MQNPDIIHTIDNLIERSNVVVEKAIAELNNKFEPQSDKAKLIRVSAPVGRTIVTNYQVGEHLAPMITLTDRLGLQYKLSRDDVYTSVVAYAHIDNIDELYVVCDYLNENYGMSVPDGLSRCAAINCRAA